MNQSSKNISEVYDRDNIAIFAVLQYLSKPDVSFIISNMHVLFNNNRGDIKLAQVYQVLNSLKVLKNYYGQKYKKVNLILCGDFNSVPNSGVYKMITEGSLDCTELDRRKVKILIINLIF
jgi:mRNA deadenylase 3'-5' endonuclease subunit Ccr4